MKRRDFLVHGALHAAGVGLLGRAFPLSALVLPLAHVPTARLSNSRWAPFTLLVVLIGLGAGSAVAAGMTRRMRRPRVALGWAQLLLPVAIAWSAW